MNNTQYFSRLAEFRKLNPTLSKKDAAAAMKKADYENVKHRITCPGCGMSANVITDACGRCGMIFNYTELT